MQFPLSNKRYIDYIRCHIFKIKMDLNKNDTTATGPAATTSLQRHIE